MCDFDLIAGRVLRRYGRHREPLPAARAPRREASIPFLRPVPAAEPVSSAGDADADVFWSS